MSRYHVHRHKSGSTERRPKTNVLKGHCGLTAISPFRDLGMSQITARFLFHTKEGSSILCNKDLVILWV